MGGTLKTVGKIGAGIGAAAAAPFTGGLSLATVLPILAGGGAAAAGLLANRGGGSSGASGTSTNPEDMLKAISSGQFGAFNDLLKQYVVEREMRDKLNQPAIDFYSAIASGDRTKAMQANAPIFSAIAEQQAQARNKLMQGPRGVGQQFALSQLPIQAADTAARAIYEPFSGSFDKLSGFADKYQNSALNTLGGSARFGEAAGQSLLSLLDINARKRGSTLGFIGDLVGSVVPGVLGKVLNTGGGSGGSRSSSGGRPSIGIRSESGAWDS